jgi:hypothetical protein
MKVIFLDIDGVLNTSKNRNPRKLPYVVERRLVNRLKRVLAKTRAKVVISSTWRYDPPGCSVRGITASLISIDREHSQRRDRPPG